MLAELNGRKLFTILVLASGIEEFTRWAEDQQMRQIPATNLVNTSPVYVDHLNSYMYFTAFPDDTLASIGHLHRVIVLPGYYVQADQMRLRALLYRVDAT